MSKISIKGRDWRPVADAFRRRIGAGDLPPGARLPSLAELVRSTGLSLHGARRAMDHLCEAGHVVSWQGRGYFVSEETFMYRIHSGTRFGDNLRAEGKTFETRLLDTRKIRASEDVARHFGIRRGAPVGRADLLRLVERRPAIFARHYFTLACFDAVADSLAVTASVTTAFRLLGLSDFHRHETLIGTRLPTPLEASYLEILTTQPVIVATGINVNREDQVVEVSQSLSRGDRVTLRA